MSDCVQFLKCMYVTVHYCMLLCGWWLHIQSIVSGIVFSVGQIPILELPVWRFDEFPSNLAFKLSVLCNNHLYSHFHFINS